MHKEQRRFCRSVKRKHGKFFRKTIVCDVGSLNINGSNEYLFGLWSTNYTGVDIVAGKNVDVVSKAHVYLSNKKNIFDVVISTECLEHDSDFDNTIWSMYYAVKTGGLLLITAAGEGRAEHGTSGNAPDMSPGTNEYYKNVTISMMAAILKPEMFSEYHLEYNPKHKDIYFYGIKK